MTIGKRIHQARKDAQLTQSELAHRAGIKQPTLSALETGSSAGTAHVATLAAILGVNALWLATGRGPIWPMLAGGTVREPQSKYASPPDNTIEVLAAPKSCGGGPIGYDTAAGQRISKDGGFFKHYNLRPVEAFAVFADGNSMAEYITDGDLVIFDRSLKKPVSGRIYAIKHPDGLRIRLIRRDIDGGWILESKHQDKQTYPDERISAEQQHLLKIYGQFIFREGGKKM